MWECPYFTRMTVSLDAGITCRHLLTSCPCSWCSRLDSNKINFWKRRFLPHSHFTAFTYTCVQDLVRGIHSECAVPKQCCLVILCHVVHLSQRWIVSHTAENKRSDRAWFATAAFPGAGEAVHVNFNNWSFSSWDKQAMTGGASVCLSLRIKAPIRQY